MAGKNLESAINQLEKVKVTRRKALMWSGLTALSAVSFGSGILDLKNQIQYWNGVRENFDKTHPQPSEEIKRGAEKYKELQTQANELADGGNLDAANQLTQSKEYVRVNTAYVQKKAIEDTRKNESEQTTNEARKDIPSLIKNHPNAWITNIVGGGFGSLLGAGLFFEAKDESKLVRKGLRKHIQRLHPEWVDNPPDAKEIEIFDKTVLSLPPMGGKIPAGLEYTRILLPEATAEAQVDKIIEIRRKEQIAEQYIHQFTVQGRLPDQFKYAAIALILHSPHITDWSKPFIDTPWGKVAPLIHDGGNTETKFNHHWKTVHGRTDFFKVSFVEKPQTNASGDKQDAEINRLEAELNADEFNRAEEERLRREQTFYQRAAFALHAASGTAPKSIPKDVKESATNVWLNFEEGMKDLLRGHGVSGVGIVKWFLDEPRLVPGWSAYGMRREADYPPIQEELIRLEEVKSQSPELRAGAERLMRETMGKIDHLLGLKSETLGGIPPRF
jgi:hypothetical protein